MSRTRRGWSMVSVLALVAAIAAGIVVRQDDATAQPAAQDFPISDGWNIIGWTRVASIEARELIEMVQAPGSSDLRLRYDRRVRELRFHVAGRRQQPGHGDHGGWSLGFQ